MKSGNAYIYHNPCKNKGQYPDCQGEFTWPAKKIAPRFCRNCMKRRRSTERKAAAALRANQEPAYA